MEGSTCRFLYGVSAREGLPAAHNRIDVVRVELHAVTNTARTLRSDYRRAAAQEGVQHNFAPARAIQDGIGNECGGCYNWVEREQVSLISFSQKGGHGGIVRNNCGRSAGLTE